VTESSRSPRRSKAEGGRAHHTNLLLGYRETKRRRRRLWGEEVQKNKLRKVVKRRIPVIGLSLKISGQPCFTPLRPSTGGRKNNLERLGYCVFRSVCAAQVAVVYERAVIWGGGCTERGGGEKTNLSPPQCGRVCMRDRGAGGCIFTGTRKGRC